MLSTHQMHDIRPIGEKLECIPEGDEESTLASPGNPVQEVDDSTQNIGVQTSWGGDKPGAQVDTSGGARSSSTRWKRFLGVRKALRSSAARTTTVRRKSGFHVARRTKSWWARVKEGSSDYVVISNSDAMFYNNGVCWTGTTVAEDSESKKEVYSTDAGSASDCSAGGTVSTGSGFRLEKRKEDVRPNTPTSRRGLSGDESSTGVLSVGWGICCGASSLRKSTNSFFTPLKRTPPRFSGMHTDRL